jgi:hypothetical protein
LLLALNLVGLAAIAWLGGGGERARSWWHRGRPDRPAVVLVVLDTVRADHLSACGYERPTSPTLEALVAAGAALRCDAVAPGSWTVPSHASLFTGAPPEVHGAHFAGGESGAADVAGLVLRPLDGRLPTLAEQMSAAGHQAVGVSANRVLRPETGLQRGFSRFDVAPLAGGWTDEGLVAPLRAALRSLDPDGGPLFLFVNLFEAHDPWPAIPTGHAFLPPRPGVLRYFAYLPGTRTIDPNGVWQRYVQERMAPAEAGALRAEVRDRYDDGVWRADRSLGRVLAEVRAHGWDAAGMRLVVTSDHGELLGEQGVLRHGRVLLEGNQRVPLLVADTAGAVPLAGELSGRVVPALVRDGALPEPLPPATAAAWPDPLWHAQSGGRLGGAAAAAIWSGGEKRIWADGTRRAVDVAAEGRPGAARPLGEDPALDQLVEAVQASARGGAEVDPEVVEALRAAGYVE